MLQWDLPTRQELFQFVCEKGAQVDLTYPTFGPVGPSGAVTYGNPGIALELGIGVATSTTFSGTIDYSRYIGNYPSLSW